MCFGCWTRVGWPAIVTDQTRAAALAAERVAQLVDSSGALIELIEEWEHDDAALDRCDDALARYRALPRADAVRVETETECLASFRALSELERASALAILDGFISIGVEMPVGPSLVETGELMLIGGT